jgi:predicted 3-demethylubiquinone-9 3-methyltransferase (glyoxalase superfamily)
VVLSIKFVKKLVKQSLGLLAGINPLFAVITPLHIYKSIPSLLSNQKRNVMQKITPFLWFNTEAEEAANFYTSIFKNSKILNIARYSEAGSKAAHRPKGSVMTVAFQIEGQTFTAINGGPVFKFTEAVSFVVNCANQEEINFYWEKLSEGGDPKSQQCGWLKDKYGLSWQIVPAALGELMSDPEKSERVMSKVLQMKKIDLNALQKA